VAFMNTVVTATGTNLAGGSAVRLDEALRAVYSRELEFKALPIMKFFSFASIKEELGVEPGLEIKMLRVNNLPKGGALTEGVRMTPHAMSMSMAAITVGERGNAVSMSELALQSAFTNMMAAATTLLGRDMAVVLDTELRDTAMSGTNVVYARKGDKTKPTGRLEMDDTCGLNVATIKDGVETLATNNAPKWSLDNGQDFYICFVHPHCSRVLRDDPAWINAAKYGAPVQLFNGEIGRIDDVRFIESTNLNNGAAAVSDYGYDATLADVNIAAGKTADLYRSVMFGEDYYGFAISLPPELRDNGVTDFGREHSVAWYAIWGAGILHDEYGVIIESV